MKSGLQPAENEVCAYLKITFKYEDDVDLDLDVFDYRCLSIMILFSEINVTAPFNVLVVFQLKGLNTQQQCAIGIWSFVYVCR